MNILEEYSKSAPSKTDEFSTESEGDILYQYKNKSGIHDETYQKYYKAPSFKPEEIQNMSAQERYDYAQDLNRERDYLSSKGFIKGTLSGLTFGASQNIPGLKSEPEEFKTFIGNLVGSIQPYKLLHAGISYPFKLLGNLTKFAQYATGFATGALTGTTGALARQTLTPGEEIDIEEAGLEGLLFGGIDTLIRGAPGAAKWLKSLNPWQEEKLLIDGVLPKNMSDRSYAMWRDEVRPEIEKIAKSQYESELKAATDTSQKQFDQEMANVRAKHEADLYNKDLSEKEINRLNTEAQKEVERITLEYESKKADIEKQNAEALKTYEEQKQAFDLQDKRDQAVSDALNAPSQIEVTTELKGRVAPIQEDLGIQPSPGPKQKLTLENKVGDIISPNKVTNTSKAGEAQTRAIRASDEVDYRNMSEAYRISDQLNSDVELIQPNLVNEFQSQLEKLESIPAPSGPQKQKMNALKAVLDQSRVLGPEGSIIEYIPVKNQVLLDQAKALRYSVDFDFAHGKPSGIFSPTIQALEDAAEQSAHFVGHDAAYQASRKARDLRRQWAETYDNDYIRPYRDTSNFDYSKNFQSSLQIDNFPLVNNVLDKSHSGQKISNATRRQLIEDKLSKFFNQPNKLNINEFDSTLKEIEQFLQPGEEYEIRKAFNEARKRPVENVTKFKPEKPPTEPKLEKLPTPPKIPKPSIRKPTEITEVRIPTKPALKETPAMKAAAKMTDISPEQLIGMTDTPTGLVELQELLNTSPTTRKLYDKIKYDTVNRILYEGNIHQKFTGDKLYQILNKGNNYNRMAQLIGEEETAALLKASEKTGSRKMTGKKLKEMGVKAAHLSVYHTLGLI